MPKRSALTKPRWWWIAVLLVVASCSGGDGPEADAPSDALDDDTDHVDVTLAQSAASLLDEVKARQSLRCGVSGAAPPFSVVLAGRSYEGFNVDYCRVIAAAILGDAGAVKFVPLTGDASFVAVQTGEVDVLIRNAPWTQEIDATLGIDFGPIIFHDGQQFMALTEGPFAADHSFAEVDGHVICVVAGSEAEAILRARALDEDLEVEVVVH
ncbi:MAG: transporter substrate-binding domain-containing protein, partial [Actinomycetota bacterium]|nr:transporter substrate-binding domain-containing protein [Actinomycetota bacterium]